MEKVKKPKKHSSDFVLRIVSIIIAVIIWFFLSITQYPTISRNIANVPVTFSLDGTQAEEKGFSVLNKEDIDDIMVDVEIKGMNYEIGGYTSSDLIATVDTSSVTKEGTYDLDIEVRSAHSADRVTITSITPATVSVSFDKITTKSVPVSVDAPLVTATEGFTLRETRIDPEEVTIEGPQNDINKISKAVVSVKKSAQLSENTTINTEDITFYDDDDNRVVSEKVTLKDKKSFDVSFVVYKKKTINLGVTIDNASSSFDKSSLPMTLSEESVSVATSDLEADNEKTIIVGNIDLSDIDLTNKYSFEIPLEKGEVNLSGEENVVVSFDPTGYISREFALTSDSFILLNKPSGKNIDIETKKLSSVKVYGPEDVVSKMTADDLSVQIDLGSIHANSSYTKNGIVYSPKYNTVWGYGLYEVQVVVSDVKADDNNSQNTNDQ